MSILYRLSCLCCPVSAALSQLPCPQFSYSCCPDFPHKIHPSCPICPVTAVLYRLPCPGALILSQLSCLRCFIPAVLSRLSCPSCLSGYPSWLFLLLSWLSLHGCPECEKTSLLTNEISEISLTVSKVNAFKFYRS